MTGRSVGSEAGMNYIDDGCWDVSVRECPRGLISPRGSSLSEGLLGMTQEEFYERQSVVPVAKDRTRNPGGVKWRRESAAGSGDGVASVGRPFRLFF